MRSRNPWVFARRRLFGWYVRLLTASLQGTSSKVAYQAYKNSKGRNACSLLSTPRHHHRSLARPTDGAQPLPRIPILWIASELNVPRRGVLARLHPAPGKLLLCPTRETGTDLGFVDKSTCPHETTEIVFIAVYDT